MLSSPQNENTIDKDSKRFVSNLRAAILGSHSIARETIADVFREAGIHSFSFAECFGKEPLEMYNDPEMKEPIDAPKRLEVYFPFLEADADRLQFRVHVHRDARDSPRLRDGRHKTEVKDLRTFIAPKTDSFLAEVRKRAAEIHKIERNNPLLTQECLNVFLKTAATGNRFMPGHKHLDFTEAGNEDAYNLIKDSYDADLEKCLKQFKIGEHEIDVTKIKLPLDITGVHSTNRANQDPYYLHDMQVGLMSYEILYHPLFYEKEGCNPLLLRLAISSKRCFYGALFVAFRPPNNNGIDTEFTEPQLRTLCTKVVNNLESLVTERYLPAIVLLHASTKEKFVKSRFERTYFFDLEASKALDTALEFGLGENDQLNIKDVDDLEKIDFEAVVKVSTLHERLLVTLPKETTDDGDEVEPFTKLREATFRAEELVAKADKGEIPEANLGQPLADTANGLLAQLKSGIASVETHLGSDSDSWTFLLELRQAGLALSALSDHLFRFSSLTACTNANTHIIKQLKSFGTARKAYMLSLETVLSELYKRWEHSDDDFERGFYVMHEQRMTFLKAQAHAILSSENPMKLFHATRLAVLRSLIFDKYGIASPAMIERTKSLIRGARTMKLPDEEGKPLPSALIYGQPGSGKDQMARMVMCFSPSFAKLLECEVKTINMAALKPSSVIIPHLFGTDKSKGVVFPTRIPGLRTDDTAAGAFILDELNSMEHNMQGSLLRWLDNGEAFSQGTDAVKYVNGLIVGVVNEDPDVVTNEIVLDQVQKSKELLGGAQTASMYTSLTESRHLRPDLVDRLKRGAYIRIPSLKERREDLPLLFTAFLESSYKAVCEGAGEIKPVMPEVEYRAFERLQDRTIHWAGNMRQLQAVAAQVGSHLFNERPKRQKLFEEEQTKLRLAKLEYELKAHRFSQPKDLLAIPLSEWTAKLSRMSAKKRCKLLLLLTENEEEQLVDKYGPLPDNFKDWLSQAQTEDSEKHILTCKESDVRKILEEMKLLKT
jgi:transcriptional regulator with AAA-type ATPase domain